MRVEIFSYLTSAQKDNKNEAKSRASDEYHLSIS